MLGYSRYRHSISYISLKRHVIGMNLTTKYMTQIRDNIQQNVFYCLWK